MQLPLNYKITSLFELGLRLGNDTRLYMTHPQRMQYLELINPPGAKIEIPNDLTFNDVPIIIKDK